jgi:hypothetical protein
MKVIETRNDLLNTMDKNLVVCEIGVFKGDFSKIMLDILSPKELHLIDIFDGMMCSGDKDGNDIIWTNLDEEYMNVKNTFSNDNRVYVHKGLSYDILNSFEDNYFDMVYIDGNHSYDGVKSDLKSSFLKVKNGGLICGHDYISSKFEGVVRAVDEFCDNHNLEIEYLTKDGCPSFCIVKKL